MVAKIVLGFAIVFILLTAGLGYKTRDTVTGLRDNLKATTENLTRTQGSLEKSKAETKTAQDEATAEKQRADAATTELASAKTAAESAAAQVKDLQAKLDAATAAATTSGTSGGTTTTGGPSAEEVDKLRVELKEAQTKLAEAQVMNTTLEGKAKAAESEASDLKIKEQKRVAGTMRPGLTGQVLAVNPGWNFVVLSLGDRQGAVMNAEMLVVRGNERIAKIRITSVEPSTSVADVVPGTAKRGARIQPGDSVIYPVNNLTAPRVKLAFRASVFLALALLAGCAHEDAQNHERVSTIPWNRPQSWEGTGALGSMVPGSR